MSPIEYTKEARVQYAYYNGSKDPYTVSSSSASIVPTVSLKKGTEFVSGDGSRTNPYIIKMYDN